MSKGYCSSGAVVIGDTPLTLASGSIGLNTNAKWRDWVDQSDSQKPEKSNGSIDNRILLFILEMEAAKNGEQEYLAAIMTNPSDESHRLRYADYLASRGRYYGAMLLRSGWLPGIAGNTK